MEAELVPGKRGEFTVWVGDRRVAKKGFVFFPRDRQIVQAVAEALKA